MGKKVVQQKYYVAAQDVKDGKTIITLLEEGEDTPKCQRMMKSPEFAGKYAGLGLPVRVCILRDEPALRLKSVPNELARAIVKQFPERQGEVLQLLADHGVSVAGNVETEEVDVVVTLSNGNAQEPPGAAPAVAPVIEVPPGAESTLEGQPEAPASTPEPTPTPILTVDKSGLIPANYKELSQDQLLEIVKKIAAEADSTWTKVTCMAAIAQHLERETEALVTPPEPQMAPNEPSQFTQKPPGEGAWENTVCDFCKALVWKNMDNRFFDQVEGYPGHNCPDYMQWVAEQEAAIAPPPPQPPMTPPAAAPGPPPPKVVAPPAAPVPPPVDAPVSMEEGPTQSGQAHTPPGVGNTMGMPVLPPQPPPG